MNMRAKLAAGSAAAAMVTLMSWAAAETPTPVPTPADTTVTCGAPIAWDATEESVKAQFGKENVEYLDLGGPEGTELFGTRVYGGDPSRRFDIIWANDEKRSEPLSIDVSQVWSEDGETASNPEWTYTDGVKVGMSIEDVEKINGKPFKLSGFGWDYGGNALDWDGGLLQTTDDDSCGISVSFNQTAENPAESTFGDKEIASNDKDVVASKPVVSRYSVFYVRPDAEETPTP